MARHDGAPARADRGAPRGADNRWAIAAASCAAMGAYMPIEFWRWAMDDAETELLLLRNAQLVVATVEGPFIVLDLLVTARPDGPGARAPLTLRAPAHRRCRWRACRVPAPLRRWATRGTPLDVSLRDRGGRPVARLFGPHSEVVLELESVTPELVPLPH